MNQNQILKQQVSYYQDNLASSSLVGAISPSNKMDKNTDILDRDQLDLLKAQILQKINRRFITDDASLRRYTDKQDYQI